MRLLTKLAVLLMAFALIAAACSESADDTDASDDTSDDDATADDDTSDDDSTDDNDSTGDDDTSDDDTSDDDSGDDTSDDDTSDDDTSDDDTGDDAPMGVTFVDACIVLMHFGHPDFPTAPYHAFLFTVAGATEDTVVEATLPDREVRTSVLPGAGIDVYWPVFEPGTFDLPTITVDGEGVDQMIADDFLDSMRTYLAEGADVRDEPIVPVPCGVSYMVPVT
jgi:hypothetical protein